MEPLDLTVRPPRGPREQGAGITFLPRTIDKLRAQLPGGKIGAYLVDGPGTASGYLLHKLRIPVDELREVVARAANDDEVYAWVAARVDPAVIVDVNAKLAGMRVDALEGENADRVDRIYPGLRGQPGIATMHDLLEADDARSFPANA